MTNHVFGQLVAFGIVGSLFWLASKVISGFNIQWLPLFFVDSKVIVIWFALKHEKSNHKGIIVSEISNVLDYIFYGKWN